MGVLDAPLRKAATAVIRTLGTSVTIRQLTHGPLDATTGVSTPTQRDTVVKATIAEYTSRDLSDTVLLGDRQVMVAAADLSFPPTTEDEVVIGMDTYRILDVESPQATDQAVMHMLQVRQRLAVVTDPSKYDKQITIQSLTEGHDDRAGLTYTPATYATRWAAVIPLTGTERFAERRDRSVTQVRFEMRSDETTRAITPKMRVSWDGRLFDIHYLIDVESKEVEVHLFTEEAT